MHKRDTRLQGAYDMLTTYIPHVQQQKQLQVNIDIFPGHLLSNGHCSPEVSGSSWLEFQ